LVQQEQIILYHDQTNLNIPDRSIYIKNHNFYTGQLVKYNVGLAGTGMIVSNTITQADAFTLEDNQNIYIVNKGQDYIGLSTVGYTTSTGIGSSLNSLYFFDDISVTGEAHSSNNNIPKSSWKGRKL